MGLHVKESLARTCEESQFIKNVLGNDFCELMSHLDAVLAGGAITSIFSNTEINDFDIFFPTKYEFDRAVSYMDKIIIRNDKSILGNFKETRKTFESDRATSYSVDLFMTDRVNRRKGSYGPIYDIRMPTTDICIQLVRPDMNSSEDVEALLQNFDYTVCMGAYIFKSEEFKFDPRFFPDLSKRQLRFNPNSLRPLLALFRMKKYESKGYTISIPEVFKIVATLMNYKVKTYRDLIEEIATLPDPKFRMHIDAIIHDPSDNGGMTYENDILDQEVCWEDVIQWVDDYHQNGVYMPNSIVSQCNSDVRNSVPNGWMGTFSEPHGFIVDRIEKDQDPVKFAQIAP